MLYIFSLVFVYYIALLQSTYMHLNISVFFLINDTTGAEKIINDDCIFFLLKMKSLPFCLFKFKSPQHNKQYKHSSLYLCFFFCSISLSLTVSIAVCCFGKSENLMDIYISRCCGFICYAKWDLSLSFFFVFYLIIYSPSTTCFLIDFRI